MKLAIFDVDGTLTTSYAMDDSCYLRAFEDEMGVRNISNNWLEYAYSTNSGIALQICEQHISRHPTLEEMARLKSRYFGLIRESFSQDSGCITEVPGACKAIEALKERPDWRVAIATGGWTESAVMKLERVGIPIAGIPIATADHALSREDIISSAIREAEKANPGETFRGIVYVGDGLWDLRASIKLGLGFVGRGRDEGERRLREGGATRIIPDYLDLELFFQALEEAETPSSGDSRNPV